MFNKKNGKKIISSLLLAPFFFIYSYFLISSYTEGDQIAYHRFYDLAPIYGLDYLLILGFALLNATEPASLLLISLGSFFNVDKNLWIAILNTVFLLLLYLFLVRYKTNPLLILLVIFNFYVVVLLTGAERLKVGYIFLLLSTFFQSKLKYCFIVLSLLSHFQMALFLISIIASKFDILFQSMKLSFATKNKIIFLFFFYIIFIVIFIINFGQAIQEKLIFYITGNIKITETIELVAILIIFTYFSKNKSKFILAFLPLFVAILFIGGDRVNIVVVSVLFYLLAIEGRQNNLVMFFLMLYFLIKSMLFVYNITIHGSGFVIN